MISANKQHDPWVYALLGEKSKRLKMMWHPGNGRYCSSQSGFYSGYLQDGTRIEVSPEIYDQQFNAYLLLKGIKRCTWSEIMGKANLEWEAYSRILTIFAEDTQQWFHDGSCGVFIDSPSKHEQLIARNEYGTHTFLERKKPNGKMMWHPGSGRYCSDWWGYYSGYLQDGTRIEVSPEIYDQRFTLYLKSHGVQRASWCEMMEKAKHEWREYCDHMNDFDEDLQQWLIGRDDIFVTYPHP